MWFKAIVLKDKHSIENVKTKKATYEINHTWLFYANKFYKYKLTFLLFLTDV